MTYHERFRQIEERILKIEQRLYTLEPPEDLTPDSRQTPEEVAEKFRGPGIKDNYFMVTCEQIATLIRRDREGRA